MEDRELSNLRTYIKNLKFNSQVKAQTLINLISNTIATQGYMYIDDLNKRADYVMPELYKMTFVPYTYGWTSLFPLTIKRDPSGDDIFTIEGLDETLTDITFEALEFETDDRNDIVNHPAHYCAGGIECIDAIAAALSCQKDPMAAWLTGQIMKYIWRWPLKNGLEDLKKARFYLDRLIKDEEKNGS